ncbi:MAG: hypothetical protein Q8Q25_01175, partial [bacterium]|nr:hypothetical protein [bacterium]
MISGELYKVEEYNTAGNLLRSTRFGYDSIYRRNIIITRSISGVGDFDQSFVYDPQGRLLSTTYPGGESLYYQYMLTGALQKMCSAESCDPLTSEVYYSIDPSTAFDVNGSLLAENYGNGVVKNYTYYPISHRVASFNLHKGSTVYSERQYQYDIYTNITALTDPLNLEGTG